MQPPVGSSWDTAGGCSCLIVPNRFARVYGARGTLAGFVSCWTLAPATTPGGRPLGATHRDSPGSSLPPMLVLAVAGLEGFCQAQSRRVRNLAAASRQPRAWPASRATATSSV